MTTGIALTILYTIGWLPLYLIRAESATDALVQYRWSERLSVLSSLGSMTLHISLSCFTASRAETVALVPAALSALVFVAGIAFWLWARRMIGPLHLTRLPEEAPLELQRHGAFGMVRNPLYLGALIAAGAPLIAIPRVFLAITYVLCCLALMVRATQDEARLAEQLGAPYEGYRREVKRRLFPLLW